MNIGSPACGMNAATRSFVRLAMTHGCRVLGVRFGFEGLVQDNVTFVFCFPYDAFVCVSSSGLRLVNPDVTLMNCVKTN